MCERNNSVPLSPFVSVMRIRNIRVILPGKMPKHGVFDQHNSIDTFATGIYTVYVYNTGLIRLVIDAMAVLAGLESLRTMIFCGG